MGINIAVDEEACNLEENVLNEKIHIRPKNN